MSFAEKAELQSPVPGMDLPSSKLAVGLVTSLTDLTEECFALCCALLSIIDLAQLARTSRSLRGLLDRDCVWSHHYK